MTAYYNELETFPAQWLRNLVAAGHITPGHVDQRDIREVKPDDVKQYTQANYFAGLGLWSYALRLAGWPDDRPVWTGSCPCQPFSSAGRRGGTDDPRHLWPEWFRLIRECRPPVVFGEQVASSDGLAWLDLVYGDLEGEGYAVAAVDLCAAGVQAPHLRQRLYFVAHSEHSERRAECQVNGEAYRGNGSGRGGNVGILAHTNSRRPEDGRVCGSSESRNGRYENLRPETPEHSVIGELGNASRQGLPICQRGELPGENGNHQGRTAQQPGGAWSDLEWLPCRDGKARPALAGIFPLAHGYPGRVGKLRAYGNAIVPQVAAEFIRAYMEATQP